MFPKSHPYSRAVLGSISDLDAASLDDVRAFFNAYYTPNNAVLVIVGDFDVAAAKAMIGETFGLIPRGSDVVQPLGEDRSPTRVRIETTDAVSTPVVYLAFGGPDAASAENVALFMASDLLGNESGPLRRTLVNSGMAAFAGGYWTPGRLGGRFIVYAGAGAGVGAAELEAALRRTIADFAAAPIDAADLERTRASFLIGDRTAIEAFESRAAYIARTLAIKGTIAHVLDDDPDLLATTRADVEAALRKVLVLADASTAIVEPGPRGDYPPVLSAPSGEPAPFVVADRVPVAIPMLTAGTPATGKLPQRQTATLSNGIEVVHYRMAGAPLLYLSAAVTGGGNNDPRGKEGLYSLAAGMGWRGAGERDLEALGRAARDIGATVGTWGGAIMSGATLSVPPGKLAAGVELLADVVQQPRFDPQEWDIVKAGTLNYVVQRDADLTGVVQRALREVVFFPAETDSRMSMTLASVEAVTLADVRAAYEAMFVPATMVVYSVGDLPVEAVAAALEPRFGAWHEAGAGVPSRPSLPVVFPTERQVYLVPMPGASQAAIHIARAAPGYDDPAFDDATAVSNLLAGDFSSRLNAVIREQKGYSYGVSASLWNTLLERSALTVTIPVQIDAAGAALEEAFKGFQSLTVVPVTDAEVNRSITAYYTSLATLPETAGGFFNALVGWESEGIDLNRTIAYMEAMTRLDVGEVRAEAAMLAPLDQAVIIIAGDPDLILPQLAALGITDVATVTLPTAAMPAR